MIEVEARPTCSVCGAPFDPTDPPPTWSYVEDEQGRLKPVLNKPIRMDSETGAVCWCPRPEVKP